MACQSYSNSELNLSISAFIDDKQEVWFKGIDAANALEYARTDQAIRMHVDEEDKKSCPLNSSGQVRHAIFINECGLYSLIFSSKMPAAKQFKRWIFSIVLPSIRKHGTYSCNNTMLMFKIQNEYDLHTKVVSYIRRFQPSLLIVAGLGENQDSGSKRIHSYRKGYTRGQPDLIINNYHKKYNGLCIEFKTPTDKGILSADQKKLLEKYKENGFKCIVSNDYDFIIRELNSYCEDIRVLCKYCRNKFRSHCTLANHTRYFHRISRLS